eukprot:Gb_36461 [translate_table: standard]
MSFKLGFAKVPAGKQTSETHCCPPQSKPKISSLHPTLYPSDFFQYSASAKLTCMTWSLFKGSNERSLSLSSVKESSFTSVSVPDPSKALDLSSSFFTRLTSSVLCFLTSSLYRSRTCCKAWSCPYFGVNFGGSFPSGRGLHCTTTTVSV